MFSTSFSLSILFACLAVVIVLIQRLFRIDASANISTSYVSAEEIIALLSPPNTGIQELLGSRALANQRLLRAFQLTNTFVSGDFHVHNAFVRRMKGLLREHEREQSHDLYWSSFLQIARQAVTYDLSSVSLFSSLPEDRSDGLRTSCCLRFAELIQLVTLRVVIVGLLDRDRDMDTIDEEDLRVSASLITELWSMSKSKSNTPPIDSTELFTLNYHLRRLLPDAEKYPNPIDFVIPTWETLWRLVATCLARVHANEGCRRVFEELLENPTFQNYHCSTSNNSRSESLSLRAIDQAQSDSDLYHDQDLCASYIMNETLRLHPPSRHISRSFPIEPSLLQKLISHITSLAGVLEQRRIRTEMADIESFQLATDIWGADALDFEPRRWARISEQSRSPTLFAFGHGPLSCVGKKWAPMAAALIVASILEVMEVKGLEIMSSGVVGGRMGWDGWHIQQKSLNR